MGLAEVHDTTVIEIDDRSEGGAHFCKNFGVGGCLRWPVDPELFEETEVESGDEGERSLEASVEGTEETDLDAARPACSYAPLPGTEVEASTTKVFPWLG